MSRSREVDVAKRSWAWEALASAALVSRNGPTEAVAATRCGGRSHAVVPHNQSAIISQGGQVAWKYYLYI